MERSNFLKKTRKVPDTGEKMVARVAQVQKRATMYHISIDSQCWFYKMYI